MRKIGVLSLGAIIAASLIAAAANGQLAMLTDQVTGKSVILESRDGKTIVTDIETNESIVVAGMLAGAISDDDYTQMMRLKRAARLQRNHLSGGQIRQDLGKGLTAYGTFKVTGGTGGFDTPTYPLTKGTVTVKIYGYTSRPGGDTLQVTLYRDIPFWFDKSYGTKSYSIDKFGKTSKKSWTVDKTAGYYINITRKTSGSYTAQGSFTITG